MPCAINRGMAEPSIEQIERDLLRARFEEGETERRLGARARIAAGRAAIKRSMNQRDRRFFIEGYKAAGRRDLWLALPAIVGWLLLIVFLIQTTF